MLKLFNVWFNDGGWHSGSLPSTIVIAEDKDSAIEKAKKEKKGYYDNWDSHANEMIFNGYKITIEQCK